MTSTARSDLFAEATLIRDTLRPDVGVRLVGFAGRAPGNVTVSVVIAHEFDDPRQPLTVTVKLGRHLTFGPFTAESRGLSGELAYRMLVRLRQVNEWSKVGICD